MARPQNWAKGLFAKRRIDLSASGEFYAHDYASSTAAITFNSTAMKVRGGVQVSNQSNAQITGDANGIVLAAGVKVSNARLITANATGFVLASESALPSTDEGAAFSIVSNSTGVALVVNSTGTTWKYLNTTSVQPT